MKDSRNISIQEFLCDKTNTKIGNNRKKIYHLFFHEDLYPLVFQNESFLEKNDIKKYKYKKRSFLTMKRAISVFRLNEFFSRKRYFSSYLLEDPFSHYAWRTKKYQKNLHLQKEIVLILILESITFLILYSQKQKSTFQKRIFQPNQVSISIHKPLEYIEKQWQYDSFGFHGSLSRSFHPEVLLRILRKNFEDVSFLHLLRQFFHYDFYSLKTTFRHSLSKKIRSVLWNIFVLEIDDFFLKEKNDLSTLNKWQAFGINQSLSCFHKMKDWKHYFQGTLADNNIISKHIQKDNFFRKPRHVPFLAHRNTLKYLRTNNIWFFFFQKEKLWNSLIKRRIQHCFKRRFGYENQTDKMMSLFLDSFDLYSEQHIISNILQKTAFEVRKRKISYLFLGYLLKFTSKKNFIRINTPSGPYLRKNFFFINTFEKSIISFLNPLYFLILLLAKKNFCTFDGYPQSKSGWVTWNDAKIIEQFNKLRNILFLFYSGCSNRKALARIQYILHFSCAKTLACKHKTNLRSISRKFGNNYKRKDLFFLDPKITQRNAEGKISKLRYLSKNQKIIRGWNFHLTKIESILLNFDFFSQMIKL